MKARLALSSALLLLGVVLQATQADGAAVYVKCVLNQTLNTFNKPVFVEKLSEQPGLNVPEGRFNVQSQVAGTPVGIWETTNVFMFILDGAGLTPTQLLAQLSAGAADVTNDHFHQPTFYWISAASESPPPAPSEPAGNEESTGFPPFDMTTPTWLGIVIGGGGGCLLIVGIIVGVAIYRKKKNDAGWY